MITVRLAGFISPPQVESVVARAIGSFERQNSGTWVPNSGPTGILMLDMSDLRSIDLPSLAELVIVLRAATDENSAINVSLPHLDNVAHFISATRFTQVLSAGPSGRRQVHLDGPLTPVSVYDRLFPLRWVDQHSRVRAWVRNTLQHAVGRESARIPWTIATQLTDLIQRELIENVERHSGTRGALVGIVADSRARKMLPRAFHATEHRAFEHLSGRDVASIHIVVADEGMGVHAALGGSAQKVQAAGPELLAWAFDRWSSSIDMSIERGTRGLYRVSKFATLYQGFATLRSSDAVATQCAESLSVSPDLPPSAWSNYVFPGTLLRVTLPISEPVPAVHLRGGVAQQISVKQLRVKRQRNSSLGSGPSETSPWWDQGIREAIRAPGINVLDAGPLGLKRDACRQFIESCARLSHPSLVAIINLPLNDVELLETCVNVNSVYATQVEQGAIDADSMSPVLTIGSRLSAAYWAGCHPDLAEALHAREVLDEQTAVHLDPSLRHYTSTGEMRLRLTPASVDASIQRLVAETSRRHTLNAPDRSFMVTPSLATANAWIDVKNVFKESSVVELLPRLLLTRLEASQPQVANHMPVILYEDGVDDEFAHHFAQLLFRTNGVSPDVVQRVSAADLECERPLNLRPNARALILVLATSEGHAARQLIAFAVRQGLKVEAVLCPVDATGKTDFIRLWGKAYPVVAGHSVALGPVRPASTDRPCFVDGPIGPSSNSRLSVMPGRVGRDLLRDANAYRAGHFIGDQARHFTFIVDPDAVFHSEAIERLLDAACAQFDLAARTTDPVIVTSDDQWPGDPSGRFARALCDRLALRFRPKSLATLSARSARRATVDSPALIVVWNSITGRSLWAAIEVLAKLGAEAVDVLAVFSQAPEGDLRHMLALRSISGRPGVETRVRVRTLVRLPLGVYGPRECPMCSRDYGRYAASSTDSGQAQEISRIRSFLAVRPWALRDIDPSHVLADGVNHAVVFAEAVSRRRELLSASESTRRAWDVRAQWMARLGDPDFISSVATLVLYEPFWLRRAPLSNGVVRRELGSSMARMVAEGPEVLRLKPTNFLDAVRYVSKSSFLEAAAEVLRSGQFDELAQASATMRLEALLDLPYIRESSFSLDVENTASRALAVVEDPHRRSQLEHVRTRARGLRQDYGTRPITLQSLLGEARTELATFHDHAVQDLIWPRPQCIDGIFPALRLGEWRKVRTWLREHLRAPLRSLRVWLKVTNRLHDVGEFHEFMHEDGSFPFLDDLIGSAEEAHEPTAAQSNSIAILETRAYELLEMFLGSKYLDASAHRPLIPAAIEECSMSAAGFRAGLARHAEGRVEVTTKFDGYERVELPIPSYLALLLVETVLANAVEHAGPAPQLDVTLFPEDQADSWRIEFASRAPLTAAPRLRLGVGGLEEVRQLCESIGCQLDYGQASEFFMVTLTARGYIDGGY